jgi:hypothetical protein
MRRAWWSAFILTTGVAAVALSAACHSSGSRVSLTNSDNGRSLAVAVGDEIDVTLQTIGPGQYGKPAVSSGSVRFLGGSSPGAPNPFGARQPLRFEVVAAGRADVTILHTDELPDGPATPAFEITIQVY